MAQYAKSVKSQRKHGARSLVRAAEGSRFRAGARGESPPGGSEWERVQILGDATVNIIDQIEVPTGHILILDGKHGLLETVVMGDYGKDVNLNESGPVRDGTPLMPLTDKWVFSISTQYGCSMGCQFCDVPKVGPGKNATLHDLQQQVLLGLKTHAEVRYSNRLNIHYARMGEPTWNPNVLDHARWMKEHIDPEFNVHPVLTTMMPAKNEWLKTMLHCWMRIKNRVYHGNAGLQLSINSTDEDERQKIFSRNALPLHEISAICDGMVPVGRKITLNFPVCQWTVDPDVLLRYFDTERFLIKLTPMHITDASVKFGHETAGDYTTLEPYEGLAKSLRDRGYDVLIFIASREEDFGFITCGNAALAVRNGRVSKSIQTRNGELTFVGGSSIGKTPFTPWSRQPDKYHTATVERNIHV